MTRELTRNEDDAALNLCLARYRRNVTHVPQVPEADYCPTCRADVVRLVDASPSETTGAERERQGWWPDGVHRAFVEGAKWGHCQATGATMFPSERDEAEAEAVKRYGEVAAPPAGDGVPRVTEDDVAHYTSTDGAFDSDCDSCARILSALSYCATRQGEGR